MTQSFINSLPAIVFQLIIGVYVYGRLTERVRQNSNDLCALKGEVVELKETVNGTGGHGERIVRLETKANGAVAGRTH